MTQTKDPEIISVDVPMQVMDYDPDTVWRCGLEHKNPSDSRGRWLRVFVSERAARMVRREALQSSDFIPDADDVFSATVWESLDLARERGCLGVSLLDESMAEVRRWSV